MLLHKRFEYINVNAMANMEDCAVMDLFLFTVTHYVHVNIKIQIQMVSG